MKLQFTLVTALMLLLLVSLWSPLYPREQWLQHVPTVLAIPALAWGTRKRVLTTGAFTCLAAMLALHILGARWIYSYVPYEDWATALVGSGPNAWFGWTRNHYDRFVHLAFGLLMPLPLVETAMRYGNLCRRWALAWAIAMVAAISAFYEVFEWLLAVIAAPQIAEHYNGQQGDAWDAQKDMALAIAGSVLTLPWLAVCTHAPGMNAPTTSAWSRWPSLFAFLGLTAAAASIGGAYGPGPWYDALIKPSFNPPNWIFPVVWTPLYVMIALAGWRLWITCRQSSAMALWFIQLSLNAAWTWLFFGQHAIGIALIDIVALAATIGAIIVLAWRSARTAALLLVPYWAWVSFATILNAEFWRLN